MHKLVNIYNSNDASTFTCKEDLMGIDEEPVCFAERQRDFPVLRVIPCTRVVNIHLELKENEDMERCCSLVVRSSNYGL